MKTSPESRFVHRFNQSRLGCWCEQMLGSLQEDQVCFPAPGLLSCMLNNSEGAFSICGASSCVCIARIRHLKVSHKTLPKHEQMLRFQLRCEEASTSLIPDSVEKKAHCFNVLGEILDLALSFFFFFSPEVCCIPTVVHACMLVTPVRTDRVLGELGLAR